MPGIRQLCAGLVGGCCCLAVLAETDGAEPMNGVLPPPPAAAIPAGPYQLQPVAPGTMPAPQYGHYTTRGAGPAAGSGPFWAPGGYEARIGSPYYYHDPQGGQYIVTGNPYYDHFGPGFQRQDVHGHYRFPYYNYRAPWYYPGRAVYYRDTNLPW